MDKHFSNIINTFKRLDEAANPAQQAAIAVNMKKQHKKPKNEGSMSDAEHHPRGAKFGGYWKGTDKNTPRPGQGVGSCEESIEETIAREWNNYLMEFGAGNNPGQGTNPVQAQQTAKQVQTTQTNLNKLKIAGVNMPVGVGLASQTVVKNMNDPKANPTTGQGLDTTGKKVMGSLGAEVEELVSNADPSTMGQLTTLIRKNKMSGKK